MPSKTRLRRPLTCGAAERQASNASGGRSNLKHPRFDSRPQLPYTSPHRVDNHTPASARSGDTPGEQGMNLVDRIRGILAEPRNEWIKIAAEPATVQTLYTGWIMILAAIGPVALLLTMHSIQFAIAQYVLSLIITFVLALIVDALAPSFGGTKDFVASLKLTAYSYTVAWLAGIFGVLGMLGSVVSLVASIYAFYTFYLGVPVLKKASPEKAVPFTLVIVLCGIVLGLLAGLVFSGMMMTPRASAGMGMLMR
jgi:hypothetical protein